MPPDLLTEMLNTYFEHMSKIALRYGGTIDKFIGDAILIFYGDPVSRGNKEDATACVSMAVEMRREMQILRQKWQSENIDKPFTYSYGHYDRLLPCRKFWLRNAHELYHYWP
jgi:adenylate cyclase